MKKHKQGFWVTTLGIFGHLILFLLSKMIEVDGVFQYLNFIRHYRLMPLVLVLTGVIILGFLIAYKKER